MKIDFLDETVITPEWNGNKDLPEVERFTVTMKALSTTHLLDLLDILSGMGIEDEDMSNASMKQAADIIKSTQTLIPEYCVITNLFTPAGEAIDSRVVVQDSRYLMLAVELFTSLMDVSQLNEEDEGN